LRIKQLKRKLIKATQRNTTQLMNPQRTFLVKTVWWFENHHLLHILLSEKVLTDFLNLSAGFIFLLLLTTTPGGGGLPMGEGGREPVGEDA
jgi:hypothetical protein